MRHLGIQYIQEYLSTEEAITKIASQFPNASGAPVSLSTLEECLEKLASKIYFQKKSNRLILEGIKSLEEV